MSFSVPAGDADALRRIVSTLSSLSGTVGETRTERLRSLAGDAEAALPPARVADFAGARADAVAGTGAVGLSLVTVGSALGDWAAALASAQDSIREAGRRHDDAEAAYRNAGSSGDTVKQEEHRQDMVAESRAAERAQGELDEARRRALAALRGEVDLWVPDAGSLTPVKAWERAAVGAAPAALALDPGALLDLYRNPDATLAKEVVSNAVKGGLKGYQLYGALTYLRAPGMALKAERKYLEARNLYQALKGSAPDLSDPKVYKQYLKAERAMLKGFAGTDAADLRRAQWLFKRSRGLLGDAKAIENARRLFPGLTDPQIMGKLGRFDGLMRPIRAGAPFAAKVFGPLGVLGGGYDMYTAVTDPDLQTDDRVARFTGGAAAAVGGTATTLMAFGVIATGPVGLTVVAVAGAVAVGAWVYENREAIAEGAKKVGSAIASGAEKVGDAVADGAKKVWKGLFG